MFKKLAEQLKANARTIVFTEGTAARILEAADKLTTDVRSSIQSSMQKSMLWLMRW